MVAGCPVQNWEAFAGRRGVSASQCGSSAPGLRGYSPRSFDIVTASRNARPWFSWGSGQLAPMSGGALSGPNVGCPTKNLPQPAYLLVRGRSKVLSYNSLAVVPSRTECFHHQWQEYVVSHHF